MPAPTYTEEAPTAGSWEPGVQEDRDGRADDDATSQIFPVAQFKGRKDVGGERETWPAKVVAGLQGGEEVAVDGGGLVQVGHHLGEEVF